MPEPAMRSAYRIAGFYALSFAIASVLLGATTWTFASATLRHALDDRLQAELATLLRADEREGRAALIADIIARDSVLGDGGYLLVGRDGHRVVGKVATATPPAGLADVALATAAGRRDVGRAAGARLPDGSILAVVAEAGSLARIETTLLAISAMGFGLMVAIGVAGGFLISRTVHRRLGAVDMAARAIIDGNLAQRIPIGPRDDEFDQLSHTLNRMLEHIGRLMDSLRHVSEDIAHDLRTPLARLRVRLETAAEAPSGAAKDAAISDALDRVDGLISLFGAILRISEVEQGAARSQFGPVRLDLLATEMVESFGPAAVDGGRILSHAIARNIVVRGDEGLIGQAIANLLDNAFKHTRPGTTIRVAVEVVEGRSCISVADNGPGVPAHELPSVLRRFGRGETSRSTAGHGLGLTLVAAIAAAHRADLVLGDASPGLIVRLLFPAEV